MMTALLLPGYCRGIFSSRELEQACEERVDFMALTGMGKPDHCEGIPQPGDDPRFQEDPSI
jgi:transposase